MPPTEQILYLQDSMKKINLLGTAALAMILNISLLALIVVAQYTFILLTAFLVNAAKVVTLTPVVRANRALRFSGA